MLPSGVILATTKKRKEEQQQNILTPYIVFFSQQKINQELNELSKFNFRKWKLLKRQTENVDLDITQQENKLIENLDINDYGRQNENES